MRSLTFLVGLSGLLGLVLADAPIVNGDANDATIVADSYIVVYNDGVNLAERQKHEDDVTSRAKQGKKRGVNYIFQLPGFNAYSAEVGLEGLSAIIKDPKVKYLERVRRLSLDLPTPLTLDTLDTTDLNVKRELVGSPAYSWGLARISRQLFSVFQSATTYVYDRTAGAGTYIYVVDTGVLVTHQEFAGRATFGANFVKGSPNTDENGHGTHVASTAAGKFVGVAKLANVIGVKVLDKAGAGDTAGVLAGVEWCIKHATNYDIARKSVINMSFGGPFSPAMNDLVEAAYRSKVTVVAAAGNSAQDASLTSPASAPHAITIGATDITDTFAAFSNRGPLVDLLAPGVAIRGAYICNQACYAISTGTSQAAPHVAGLVAYFMGLRDDPVRSPGEAKNRLRSLSSKGDVKQVPKKTNNKLVYNGSGL